MRNSLQRTEPKARGVVFAATVPALIDGSKTQGRWPVKGVPVDTTAVVPSLLAHRGDLFDCHRELDNPVTIRCPLGAPGDRIFAKERWDYFGGNEYIYQREPSAVLYEAGGSSKEAGRRWRSALVMPRWASRALLEIVHVRIQRLGDVTEDDARAELGSAWRGVLNFEELRRSASCVDCAPEDTLAWFAAAWERTHGDRRRREFLTPSDPGYKIGRPWRSVRDTSAAWTANPWTWVLALRLVPMT